MADLTSLESLQALYSDLLALSESRLSSLERLGAQLDAHVKDFKDLLDKNARSEQSRQSLSKGCLDVSGEQYSINEQFQQDTLKLANELNLDELDAARLYLDAQDETDSTGRPALTNSLIRFHQRRKHTLECLRLILQQASDVRGDEPEREAIREDMRGLVTQITQPQNGVRYASRCLSAMDGIKVWLRSLAEKVNSASVLGQAPQSEFLEAIEYQRASLIKQHECLGVILLYMVKDNASNMEDFEILIESLKKADKYDNLLVHYLPALSAYVSRFGGDSISTLGEARALHNKIFDRSADENSWGLKYIQAAFRTWWLVEYSSWYGDNYDGSLSETQLDEEAKQRSKLFNSALKDGAFDFILSVSTDIKSAEWNDPARLGIRDWLQRTPPILADSVSFSSFFQEALMEQLETFIEAFITNLHDVLRKLRIDEDEQRQLSKEHEHDLDLEKFLVIIANTYEGRPKAALEAFWDVPDGALIGFVHWTSRRASTPLVSAFCEMLQSISEDEDCATAAHEFLLDEGAQSSGKMRRNHSLTWNQIFKELTFFSNKIRDRPALPQIQNFRSGKSPSDLGEAEPESVLMLEAYMRLITRLCSESLAARTFLSEHPTFSISELLFQLASSAIPSRLRACAFTAIRSFLSFKTKVAGEYVWSALDVWISGGYSPASLLQKTPSSTTSGATSATTSAILRGLSSGFEEPNAFIQLLHALILPYNDEAGLNDALPFPEILGTSTRQPGVDPYIDFALGQIFGERASELTNIAHLRLLQLTCLNFIATCLDTFNEDLVIFADQSNVLVDSAIQTSNLPNYILLHPFSRVMEWMYNEKVMEALFSAVNQDPSDVANAAPDSPLVLCILQGLHVITTILDLQPTYLNIIRPFIKSQPNHKRVPVSSAAFGTFEDGVLNHLDIFPNLGLFCGTGHPELVIASLELLEKLSAAPKLSSSPGTRASRSGQRNKALAAMDDDAETVSKTLLREIEADIDINEGPQSSTYIIKVHVLDFLIACLRATPSQPSIAHLLLGFRCEPGGLSIEPEGSFSRGVSLFHTVLDLALNSPLGDDSGISSWLVSLNYKAYQVMREIWTSPLGTRIAMAEMRANEAFFVMFAKEPVIQNGIAWDGLELTDLSFCYSAASSCLSEFLSRRALILQYLSAELRLVAVGHSPSLQRRLLESLLGSTTLDDGQNIDHQTIFDLFDFMEPEFERSLHRPQAAYFKNVDFSPCLVNQDDSSSTFDLAKVQELLLLRRAELVNATRLENTQDLATLNTQAQELLSFYAQENQVKQLSSARLQVLRAWVQLMLVIMKSGQFDDSGKTAFVLRALQTIMPRLESDFEVVSEALELARLAKALIFSLDFKSETFKQGDMGNVISERLYHLFQISLRAISNLGAMVSLKEFYYNICYCYLAGMSDASVSGLHRKHSIQTIKTAGDRFMDLICDDAYGAEPICRIAALLVLGALVKMGQNENSKYIIDSLVRLNFVGILVDSLQGLSSDLSQTSAEDVDLQLSYCHARLSLLLQISQTRFGSGIVLGAGFFHAVKISGIFACDPDLGVDIEGPDAISKHYSLLTAVMRVLCASVLSRGPQNQQTLEQGRRFLGENRLSILAVFKRSAGLGNAMAATEQSLDELADSFMLLISVSGFLEFEDQTVQTKQTTRAFTEFT